MGFIDRLQHGWNAFMNRDPTSISNTSGESYYYRPDRARFSGRNEKSIVNAVFNRIALDVACNTFKHVRVDENEKYIEDIDSGLNDCLNIEANLDQTGRAFIQDAVMSLFDEGCIALVPIDTTFNPLRTGSYDIHSIRVGKIVTWYPQQIKVRVYNEKTGRKEEITVPKKMAAIVENPFYSVVNEPNSTVQRLIRKLNLLVVIDEQSGSGKLDLIIQLPYTVKGEIRKQKAEERRKDIEKQLNGSKLGIAYVDSTEKITQLNRPIENNLLKQVEYLLNMVYSQLSITTSVMDGTADEKTMLNYNSRTVEPIASAIVDEMYRKFITKTARSQGQRIMMFKNPFKLVPVSEIAEIADKLTRNEIASSNEIRQIIGWKPSQDPKADELRNKNLNQPDDQMDQYVDEDYGTEDQYYDEEENQNGI